MIEHTLEHMDFRSDVPGFLTECHRLLEPGGMLRIVVPDAERFLKAYATGDRAAWQSLGWDLAALPSDLYTRMHVVNHVFHQGGEHLFGYDFETLSLVLKRAGFATVKRTSFRQSADPELAIDQDNHRPYSLYVDATK